MVLSKIMLVLVEKLVQVKEIDRFDIELIDVRVRRVARTHTNVALFVHVRIITPSNTRLEVALVSNRVAHEESVFLQFNL